MKTFRMLRGSNENGTRTRRGKMAGHYDSMGAASISGGGVYLNSGHQYTLEVLRLTDKLGRKGDVFFIAEMLIHESDDPLRTPGMQVSWTANLTKHEAAMGNVKWLLACLNGIDPTDKNRVDQEITSRVTEFAVSPANPLKGKMVEVAVQNVKTKSNSDFSKHAWAVTTRPPSEAVRAKHAASAAAASPYPQPAASPYPTPGYPPAASPYPHHTPAPSPYPQQGYPQAAPPSPYPQQGYPQAAPPSPYPQQPYQAAPPPVPQAPPPPPAAFPPAGWVPHDTSPGWFHNFREVVSEADLRLRASQGRA